MKILYLGNNRNGLRVLRWLYEREEIVGLVVHPPEKGKFREEIIRVSGLEKEKIFDGQLLNKPVLPMIKTLNADICISINFGFILKKPFLNSFPKGCINLHAGYLPYNRGAHPNVWSIVDETPAGVTLHYIDEEIDAGDIIAQKKVPIELWDTGKSLYEKLEDAAFELFRATWPSIRNGTNQRFKQPTKGTLHHVKNLRRLDKIDLDSKHKAKDLLNILRARTFPPYDGCYMEVDGKRVYLRLQTEVKENCD